MAEKVISSVSQYLEAFRVSMSDRLTALEVGIGPVVSPPLFSDILKEGLDERTGANKDETPGVEVNASGKTKTILPQQVLVGMPKDGIDADQATLDLAKNKVQMALKSMPLDSCKKNRNGGLMMKFPSKECKQRANAAIKGCLRSSISGV